MGKQEEEDYERRREREAVKKRRQHVAEIGRQGPPRRDLSCHIINGYSASN